MPPLQLTPENINPTAGIVQSPSIGTATWNSPSISEDEDMFDLSPDRSVGKYTIKIKKVENGFIITKETGNRDKSHVALDKAGVIAVINSLI